MKICVMTVAYSKPSLQSLEFDPDTCFKIFKNMKPVSKNRPGFKEPSMYKKNSFKFKSWNQRSRTCA